MADKEEPTLERLPDEDNEPEEADDPPPETTPDEASPRVSDTPKAAAEGEGGGDVTT